MFIYVNSNRQELPDLANVKDTLDCLNISSQRGIAIAINNNVVPRQDWEMHVLQPDDKMTIIKATQGG